MKNSRIVKYYFLGEVFAGGAVSAFLVASAEFAVFIDELLEAVFDGAEVIVLVLETGAGVVTDTGVDVLAGLFAGALLAGVSPHAIPKALSPRTAESTITFVIFLQTPIFLKD